MLNIVKHWTMPTYADEVCLNYVSTHDNERQALDMRAWHQKGPSLAPVRGKDGKDGKDSNCLHRHVMTPTCKRLQKDKE